MDPIDALTEKLFNLEFLPKGSSMTLQGHELTSTEHYHEELEALKVKSASIQAKFTGDKDLVGLSRRVQSIKIRFLTSFGEEVSATGNCRTLRVIREGGYAYADYAAIMGFFVKAVTQQEVEARKAFQAANYDLAHKHFSAIAEALSCDKASPRYFHVHLALLATLLKQSKVREAIDILLRLEREIPNDDKLLRAECAQQRKAITDVVVDLFNRNEGALKGLEARIRDAGGTVRKLLSGERLQQVTDLRTYLSDLRPVQVTLDRIEHDGRACLDALKDLVTFYQALGLEPKSRNEFVGKLLTYWRNLNGSAIQLFEQLVAARTREMQCRGLVDWISHRLGEYRAPSPEPIADDVQPEQQNIELSAVYKWALTYLGALYASNEVSQNSLTRVVCLMRENSDVFFRYGSNLRSDVKFCFGQENKGVSLLFLAVLSEMIQNEYCTVVKIRMRTDWTWSWLYQYARSVITRETLESVPQIVVTQEMMARAMPHAKNPVQVLHRILTTFQECNEKGFDQLSAEQKVTLFESAYDFLLVAKNIAEHWIEPQYTKKFEDELDALEFLRVCQARRSGLPYERFKTKLKELQSSQFLQWIGLYNPERNGVTVENAEKYAQLFFVVADTAELHFADEKKFTDEEVYLIATFLINRYRELKKFNLLPKTAEDLDSRLTQFMARCVKRTSQELRQRYFDAPVLHEIESLHSEAINAIAGLLLDKGVRDFLEQAVYPHLKSLRLDWGISEHNDRTDFRRCTNLLHLEMPLTSHESAQELQWIATHLQALASLTLRNGPVYVQALNDMKSLGCLSLVNIHEVLDLSGCNRLQWQLRELYLHDVTVRENSLSWVGASRQLSSLQLSHNCIQGAARIGSLMPPAGRQINGNPCITQLLVGAKYRTQDRGPILMDLDQDPGFKASLLALLDAHSAVKPVKDLTLFATSQGSLLEWLRTMNERASLTHLTISLGRKAFSEQAVQEYAQQHGLRLDSQEDINWVVGKMQKTPIDAELDCLADFSGLEYFTFHSDDYAIEQHVRDHIFRGCPNLKKCVRVMSDGSTTDIPIKRN